MTLNQLIKDQELTRSRYKLDAHLFNVYTGRYGDQEHKRVASGVALSPQAMGMMLKAVGHNPCTLDVRSAGISTKPITFVEEVTDEDYV